MKEFNPRLKQANLSEGEYQLWLLLETLYGSESLLDWIPILSPSYQRPEHLRPLIDVLIQMINGPVNAHATCPPRHSKTETILHYIAYRLMLDPTCEIIYCTYEANLAYSKSRKIRDLVERAGVKLKAGASGIQEWHTDAGGRVTATGMGGPITGKGANLLIIDDFLKNRAEAESPVIRDRHWEWFTSTAFTRIEPGGSCLINATRWHQDDLIGRIEQNFPDWLKIHLPAIREENGKEKALWPQRWPLKALRERRSVVGEFDWASLFQGEPRPKGGRLFNAPSRYNDPMIVEANVPYRIIIGADPAATANTSSDYSVACVMACVGDNKSDTFRADILEVWRGQVEIPIFVSRLRDLANKWRCPIAVEAVAGFKAVPQMLRQLDPKLRVFEAPAVGDKFTRALPVSAAWNSGRVRIPAEAAWVGDFLTEVEKFTGVKDAHDDCVDAMAHAFNSAQLVVSGIRPAATPVKNQLPFG